MSGSRWPRTRWIGVSALALVVMLAWAGVADAGPRKQASAELLHFTADLTEAGTPLRPDFEHDSMWNGLGRGADGRIYLAASNHRQPGGNVAVYVFDPARRAMRSLGELKGISAAAGNWMAQESQHKVHTFLLPHADGSVYFASDDYEPTPFLRGAHLYRIKPGATDDTHGADVEDDAPPVVEDVSKTFPTLMTRDLEVIENTGDNAERSGVMIEYYGIKGISLNPAKPSLLYAMTYPEGHLIRVALDTGAMKVVGRSRRVNYIFHTDAAGRVTYGDGDEQSQQLLRYDPATDQTAVLAERLPPGDFGAIAASADGNTVFILIAEAKRVYRLDVPTGRVGHVAGLCGENRWRVYNLHLSPDDKNLYYVSNNNDRKTIRRVHIKSGLCREVLDIDALLGTRDLCFGGVGVWDDRGAFYAPVWTHPGDKDDLAILRAAVEQPPDE